MILRYEPLTTVPATEQHRPDLATSKRVECKQCGKTSVSNQAVAINTVPHEEGGMQSYYHLYCDHCNLIHAWWSKSDDAGRAMGMPITQHITLRGSEYIANFLRRFPHAAGLEQT